MLLTDGEDTVSGVDTAISRAQQALLIASRPAPGLPPISSDLRRPACSTSSTAPANP